MSYPLDAVLAACPAELPQELVELIERFAIGWSTSGIWPAPTAQVCAHWSEVLAEWAASADLPLFVRKPSNNRGSEVAHSSGRKFVPTDNSPAHWSYTLATGGVCPTLAEIRAWLAQDRIPIAMVLKTAERPAARLRCCLSREHNINLRGWKLAHISDVGLRARGPLVQLPLEHVCEQFVRLMSPANMFLVPLAWSGLAEIRQVIDAVGNRAQDARRGVSLSSDCKAGV